MSYIYRQKLHISELVEIKSKQSRVLLHEPEEYLAALYRHYLHNHNFDVKHCPNIEALRQGITEFQPHIVVLSVDSIVEERSRRQFLPRLISDFPELKLISVSHDSSHQKVSELMSAGVCGHVNRKLSRPEDLAVIIKSVLHI